MTWFCNLNGGHTSDCAKLEPRVRISLNSLNLRDLSWETSGAVISYCSATWMMTMLNVQCNNWSTPPAWLKSHLPKSWQCLFFLSNDVDMQIGSYFTSHLWVNFKSLANLGFGLCQVFTLSLAALGSLMWLRKNKPSTLVPFIYASAGVVATMPSITRSGSSLNPLIFFLCDHGHLISKYQMNGYIHNDWNMHQLHPFTWLSYFKI